MFLRGGGAPSFTYTPFQPIMIKVFYQCIRPERGQGRGMYLSLKYQQGENQLENIPILNYNNRVKGSQEGGARMANQVGKRYRCTKCGAEMIITKGGDGTITCCGQPMEQKK